MKQYWHACDPQSMEEDKKIRELLYVTFQVIGGRPKPGAIFRRALGRHRHGGLSSVLIDPTSIWGYRSNP